MIQEFLKRGKEDLPIFIGEVREAFEKKGKNPFHVQVKLYDESIKSFELMLPDFDSKEEVDFVSSYVYAFLYNILSSLGAMEISIFIDTAHSPSVEIMKTLDTVFQTKLQKSERSGYGKCLNVNERTLNALWGEAKHFCFSIHDIKEKVEVKEASQTISNDNIFAKLPSIAEKKLVLGMDIGGTDVKLVASINGKLAVFKEFDWFPASFDKAEQLIDPIVMLTRLLLSASSLVVAGKENLIDEKALDKHASFQDMEKGIEIMEKEVGSALLKFDAIGLCFPDVVIDNLIVGGETYKTRGMRNNASLDYEKQFAKITNLCDLLKDYVTEEGCVCNTNDGPMAAFTSAVEEVAVGEDVSKGFIAHTLGTELGTGWVLPNGSIPKIPLEVYNFIIDLGSFEQKKYEADDVRSVNNFNTHLAGTLQKFACQSGVFRLAAKYLPSKAPEVYQEALDKNLFSIKGDKIIVPTEPKDMRKACLEFFMAKASDKTLPVCQEIFRQIGESLGSCWQEVQYIMSPEATERTLYGRLVKNPDCFALLCEGAKRIVPNIVQKAADGDLANTSLMKQLEAHPDYTVAQFAQAVGAVYYGCVGLIK